ncbi:hypothetical protein [Rhodovarius crocodyli]|uniref:hypothetical protein n=1 Tax=Rhodovarius crocodyli TaxID=1979269 RepID=UPI0013E3ACE3|nr:hypothetical protein [Rhodovarius crocodyli]
MKEALIYAGICLVCAIAALADGMPWLACAAFWVCGLWSGDVINITKRRMGYTKGDTP